ncbi:HesA/MoeB/ThiF family protein [Shewanella submarina]|uniref:HesA/MoeB/ThiF family protein n=1 Tax=Shewanella submarina TaxID=2016376 RepID=A0ABV7GBV8_9GAMM|nr:HesA/MoeB/ThiF family protein [Shewanella submarina]
MIDETSATEELSAAEFLRYSRQLMLPELGEEGQLQLKRARVLVVGAGGLGSAALLSLAAAGVGQIHIADPDAVELSNLQRQLAFESGDVGINKAKATAARLTRLNPHIQLQVLPLALRGELLAEQVASVDLVLDCSDNLSTRYQVNQKCAEGQKPLVSGAATGWQGQLMTFDFRRSDAACYQCLFPFDSNLSPDDAIPIGSCRTLGIMGPVVNTLGTLQALQAIKLILGLDADSGMSYLRRFNGLTLEWQTLAVARDADCPVCGYQGSRSRENRGSSQRRSEYVDTGK